MDQQKVKELLTRYRLGQCSEEEAAWIENWYTRTAKVSDSKVNLNSDLRLESWRNVKAAITPEPVVSAKPGRNLNWYLAASVAAILCIGFFYFYQSKERKSARNEMVSLSTKTGEIASYILPDSSKVTLNGGSLLTYPKVFSSSKREIVLKDGEAFFDVKKDQSRPFIVYAGRTRTHVLGTAFCIRAYHFLKEVQVTVTRGKVAVDNAADQKQAQTEILLPGDRLTVNNKSGDFERAKADAGLATGWLKGLLNFDNEELATITLLLEKKFNVPISIPGSELKNRRLTAKFKADETLDEILETLGAAGNFQFKHKNGEVLIY